MRFRVIVRRETARPKIPKSTVNGIPVSKAKMAAHNQRVRPEKIKAAWKEKGMYSDVIASSFGTRRYKARTRTD